MEFVDFEIRAWQVDDDHLEVLVHSSPAGDMQRPVTTPFDAATVSRLCQRFRGGGSGLKPPLTHDAPQLSTALLPPPVFSLLQRSLDRIPAEDGLRVRLCLDRSLVDLPWECLYRPDAPKHKPAEGFLALDPRISLVREAPARGPGAFPVRRKQALLFAGAPYIVNGKDSWDVERERDELVEVLKRVDDYLSVTAVTSPQIGFDAALAAGRADIFHYSGHAEPGRFGGCIVEEIRNEPTTDSDFVSWAGNGNPPFVKPLSARALAKMLSAARTRLAVLSACNSGRWAIVEPLLKAGLSAVVGSQGLVTVKGASAFCHKLYEALALGLSLDEATTWARLWLVESGLASPWEWAYFMVYMPTSEAVLFPKPKLPGVRERQEAARKERQQTVVNVTMHVERYIESKQVIGTVESGATVTGVRQLPQA